MPYLAASCCVIVYGKGKTLFLYIPSAFLVSQLTVNKIHHHKSDILTQLFIYPVNIRHFSSTRRTPASRGDQHNRLAQKSNLTKSSFHLPQVKSGEIIFPYPHLFVFIFLFSYFGWYHPFRILDKLQIIARCENLSLRAS